MNETSTTPLEEKVRAHAVDLLAMVARYRFLVAAAATLAPETRRQAAVLDREAEELLARCTGVTPNGSTATDRPNPLQGYADAPRG